MDHLEPFRGVTINVQEIHHELALK